MIRASRTFLLASAVTLGVAALDAQQPRSARGSGASREAGGTGAIVGRLTAWGTGAPVRGAEVTALLSDGSGRLTNPAAHQAVVTGDDGTFEFHGLPHGAWKVTASKTGYVAWQLGQRRPFEVPPLLVLSPGRDRVTADFSIPTAGAIEGHVYDELGEPVANAQIAVYRSRMVQSRRHLQRVGRTDSSDDTGGFRIYGLAPGHYYVAASLRVAPADSVMDTTYAPTYFPGTGNLVEAQRITIEPGGEAFADFRLLPVRRVRVAGSVFTSGGGPASAFLSLVSDASEHGVPLGAGAATREDGGFTLADVAPGRYTLFVSLRGPDAEAGEIPLTIGDDDVTGLTLVTTPPTAVRGTFAVDPAAMRPLPRAAGITARSMRACGPMTAGTVSGSTFEIAVPPGPFALDVHGLPAGWTVKSIQIAGIDATDGGVDLRSRRSADARIVLTNRVTEVTGVVPAGTHSVVIFPADPARWSNPARNIRAAVPDAKGAFRAIGLPPGPSYRAIAVDYLEEGEGEDPDFLSSVSALATPLSLAEGQRLTVAPAFLQR